MLYKKKQLFDKFRQELFEFVCELHKQYISYYVQKRVGYLKILTFVGDSLDKVKLLMDDVRKKKF